jgi:hypothetical protein
MDKKLKYPDNWTEIAERAKRKAGYRCTHPNCKHKHDPQNGFTLTVHHIDGNPMNNPEDGSNHAVLCQRCHLRRQAHLKKYGYNKTQEALKL